MYFLIVLQCYFIICKIILTFILFAKFLNFWEFNLKEKKLNKKTIKCPDIFLAALFTIVPNWKQQEKQSPPDSVLHIHSKCRV